MDRSTGDDNLEPLRTRAVLQEHRFNSRVPVIGGLIAAFRSAWNNVSARWYMVSVMQQQSEFNQLTVDRLAKLMARIDRQTEQLAALREVVAQRLALSDDPGSGPSALEIELSRVEEWLIDQDREQTELRHDVGELAVLVGQLLRAQPEAGPAPDQPGPLA